MLTDPRHLARLVELSLAINSTLELKPLLQGLLAAAADLLDCEKASILLHNETRGDLSFVTALGTDADQLVEIPVPIDGSLAGAIFRANEPLIINDVASDPRHFTTIAEKTGYQPKRLLGVPMRLRGATTGVMETLNKRSGDFTKTDADVLSVIAAQAAVAIHNARLVRELRDAHEELSRIDKIKTRFMALATHELRTPLAIITGYAEFLHQNTLGTSSRHAAKVLNAALQQRAIIEQMTNMTLLQLGSVDLRMTTLSARQLLDAAWEAERAEADAKALRFTSAPAHFQATVLGDAERLPLVFRNVFNNAVRFTPSGGAIEVGATTSPREVHVTVRDTGTGIPAGELANIFKDYYQVEDHMTRRHGGLGLGLAIARAIVALHGGRIWAESPGLHQGTTINIVLPRHHEKSA